MPSDAKANTPHFKSDDLKSAKDAAEAVAAQDGTLEAAGDARTEQLNRRAEELIAKAEAKLAEQDVYGAGDRKSTRLNSSH